MKWKLDIELKLLEKMELELKWNFLRMEITRTGHNLTFRGYVTSSVM